MEKKTYEIKGMSCAACAAKVERAVSRLSGVQAVNVMLLKNRMTLVADPAVTDDQAIIAAVRNAGYDACAASVGSRVQSADDREVRAQKTELVSSFVLLVILMLVSMGSDFGIVLIDNALVSGVAQLTLTLAIMVLQRRYFRSAFRALLHLGSNMDTLVSMGSLVSFCYSVYHLSMIDPSMTVSGMQGHHSLYFETAAAILTFVAIGKYFEGRTKVRTTDAVMMLYDLAPKFVNLVRDGRETQVALSEVREGDVLAVRAGEQLGIDGTVIAGEGYADESSLTGESRPVKKTADSKVVSASVLTAGELTVRADAVGPDTTLSKIIALVDDATSKKAPIARLADKIAGVFVPAVLALAALTFIVWYCALDAALGTALNFAVSVLVVSCPCALGLATPLAIVAGTGRAARAGILFKSPEVIEELRKASVYVFDKTGTLTSGNMSVTAERFAADLDVEEIRAAVAALERKSAHPLARAVARKYGDGNDLAVEGFAAVEGEGIEGTVLGSRFAVGNARMLKRLGAEVDHEIAAFGSIHEDAGSTVLHVIRDGKALGVLVIADEIKPSSRETVALLHKLGITCLMLTGDSEAVARSVARELGIREFRASLMPQDKAEIIRSLQSQGHNVVMIGDGVNDAVALATANTGIGLAGTSDIAVSSCGVVLLKGSLRDCVNAAIISRATMGNIRENLFWAFIYNVIFIPVAAGLFSGWGWTMNPMVGAVLMSLSSVCVGLNALRLTRLKISSVSDKKESSMNKKVLNVEGMMCQHCVASVTKALKAVPGVTAVEVSLERKCAEVSFEDGVSAQALSDAVTAAGYEVKGMHD